MATELVLVGLAAAAPILLAVVEARRHVRAARAQSAAGLDDDEVTPFVTRLRLIGAEVGHTLAGLVRALVPAGRTSGAGDGRRAVVIVTASLPAHGCARRLAARLRREGLGDVELVRLGVRWPGFAAASARLASVLAHRTAMPATVIAHGASGLAARVVAGDGSSVQALVTLGTPHGERALGEAPPRLEAVAIASCDDARLARPGVAHWSGACNVSVRGIGHLGMLATPRVHDLVVESLSASLRPPGTAPEHGRRV